jgi:chorismate mutase
LDWEGKIATSQLSCAASGRALAVGEDFYSGLVLAGGQFLRRDFAAESWPAQDRALMISWWRQRVPSPEQERRAFRLNAESLAQIFANLKDARARIPQCLAYVVALALVRARKLHFVGVERDEHGSVLVIEDRRRQLVHRVRDPAMNAQEEREVLDNLLAVAGGAGADAAAGAEGDGAAG